MIATYFIPIFTTGSVAPSFTGTRFYVASALPRIYSASALPPNPAGD